MLRDQKLEIRNQKLEARNQKVKDRFSSCPLPTAHCLLPTAYCLLLSLLLLLAGCAQSGVALSGVGASTAVIVPGSSGVGRPPGAVEVRYTLGSAEDTQIVLVGPTNYTLLSERQEAGVHLFRFNGVVEVTQPGPVYNIVRRAVPPGDYTLRVGVGGITENLPLKVADADTQPPSVGNIVVRPEIISPNSDAIDDVSEVTFRTEGTATLSLDLGGADGRLIPIFAPTERAGGEQNVPITGRDTLGDLLPNGVYTLTIRAQDRAGNRVEAQRPLTIEGGGEPEIEIVKVEITPRQIIIGQPITVSITVKNVGKVPLRTQGPEPGYRYTTNDSYSSIKVNELTDKPGLWRVGVDWDGNSGGGGAYRYPFRWGFGKTLMPGEEVTTGGQIVILKQESRMWFYGGVLQEGVRIVRDRLGRMLVQVSF